MPKLVHGPLVGAILRMSSVLHMWLLLLFAVFPATGNAVPGALDPSFGTGGIVRRNVTVVPADDGGRFMLHQSDGKTILEGTCATEEGVLRVCLVRYLANGTLDTSFNRTGNLVTSFDGLCSWHLAAVSLNSKIHGYGQCGGAGYLLRFNDDGSPDATFGVNGSLMPPGGMLPVSIAVQGDKLIVEGACTAGSGVGMCLQRLTAEGQLDASFGAMGSITSPYGGFLAINADKIVTVGSCENRPSPGPGNPPVTDICVAVYTGDGSLDTAFNGTGRGIYSITTGSHTVIGAALDGDRIVVGATCNFSSVYWESPFVFCAARISASGALDTSFNASGKLTLSAAPNDLRAGAFAMDGNQIVIGRYCSAGLALVCITRFNADGSVDATLNASGTTVLGSAGGPAITLNVNALLIDGTSILLGGGCRERGDEDFCVVRLTRSGAPDASFSGTGRVVTPLGIAPRDDVLTALARHSDGKVFAAGQCNLHTVEYFNDHFCVAKFNADGTPDTSFKGNGRTFTSIGGISRPVAVATIGDKAVVAGYCTADNEYNYDFCVVRYLANGELDPSFNGSGVVKVDFGGGHDYSKAMAIDGTRILVTGQCLFAGTAVYRFCALRLNDNGSLDTSFGAGGKVDVAAWEVSYNDSVFIVNDKIYVPNVCGSAPWLFCILRLNADGSPDVNFGIGGRMATNIGSQDYGGVSSSALDGQALLLAGKCQTGNIQQSCLIRLLLDGTVDAACGNNSHLAAISFDSFSGIVVASGRATVSGNCSGSGACVARFGADGLPDLSFGIGGIVKPIGPVQFIGAAAMAADRDRVLVGGACGRDPSIDFCIARLDNQMPPGVPQLLQATGRDQKISVVFAPPISNGGAAILEYRLSCDNGAITATGASSPLQIAGLTNGVTYQCSLSAVNANGIGTAIVFTMSPTASPVALLKVLSRKLHGAAGSFEIAVDHAQPINGALAVEPRASTVPHLLAFQFDGPIASVGIPVVTDVSGATLGSATASINGNNVDVQLGGIGNTNSKRLTVRLPGVNGNQGGFAASVAFLLGDVNGTYVVDASDVSEIKAHSGRPVDLSNFRHDLNASGTVSAADIAGAKARIGASIP